MDPIPGKLLIVDEDEGDYLFVQQMLAKARGRRYELDWANTRDTGLKMARAGCYDAILMDSHLSLRSHGGLDLTGVEATNGGQPPIIYLIGQRNPDVIDESLPADESACLPKDELTSLLLERAIHYAIEHKHDQDRIRRQDTLLADIYRDNAERDLVDDQLRSQASILATITDAVIVTDLALHITSWNKSAESLYGWKADEVIGLPSRDVLRSEISEAQRDEVYRSLTEGQPALTELTQYTRDNHKLIVDGYTIPLRDPAGAISGFVVVNRDITERRQKEEELRQLNRTLTAHSESSSAMMRAVDEPSYLNEVCRIVNEVCGYAMVWIGFAENDEAKSVRAAAYAGFDQGYIDRLKLTWADSERGRGPTGTAIRTGQICQCHNMLTDPKFIPWREEAIKRGYASSIVFPLKTHGTPFGALTVYAREPEAFTDKEVDLLSHIAEDLAIGITILRLRKSQAETHEELAQQREWLRTTLTSIGDGVIATDPQGRVTFLNPVASTLTGWSPADAEGQPVKVVFNVIIETTREPAEDYVARTLEEKRVITLANHTLLVARDGREIAIEDSAAPILTAKGEVQGVVLVFHDITEKRRLEAILEAERKQLAYLASFPENNPMPVVEMDLQGNIRYANPASQQLLPDLKEHWSVGWDEIMRSFQDGKNHSVVRDLTIKDRIYQQNLFHFGQDGYIRSYAFDITERKLAEEHLAFQADLLENVHDAIIATDDQLTITWWNKAAEDLYGWTRTEVIGKSAPEILQSEVPVGEREYLVSRTIRTNIYKGEVAHHTRSGRRLIVESNMKPYRDAAGRVLGFIIAIRDISERKEAESRADAAWAEVMGERNRLRAMMDTLPVGVAILNAQGGVVQCNRGFDQIWGTSQHEATRITELADYKACWADSGQPVRLEEWASSRAIGKGETVIGQSLKIERFDGSHVNILNSAAPILDDQNRVTGCVVAIMDVNEQREMEEELRLSRERIDGVLSDIANHSKSIQALEQRVDERTLEVSTLLTISSGIGSNLELSQLFEIILDQLALVVPSTSAMVLLLTNGQLDLISHRVHGQKIALTQTSIPLASTKLFSKLVRTQKPILIEDQPVLAIQLKDLHADYARFQSVNFGEIGSWLGVPIVVKGQVTGIFCLTHDQPTAFSHAHSQLVQAIANQAGVAVENLRLYTQMRDLATFNERQRLARELHDSVSQALYGITLGCHVAIASIDNDPVKLKKALDYILGLADTGLTEMRALIFDMRPETLEKEGLVAALQKQTLALQARLGIHVDTHLMDEPALPYEVKGAFYRIAMEALNNASKHAKAGHILVTLESTEDGIELVVKDDGKGFDPGLGYQGHLGLASMRERAVQIGADIIIDSAPGRGTRISLKLKQA